VISFFGLKNSNFAITNMSFTNSTIGASASHSETRRRANKEEGAGKDPYRIGAARKFLYQLASAAPPLFRERVAEAFLRRPDSPGPAAEHAFQHALGERLARGGEPGKAGVVAKAADNFYGRQYRQLLNPTMGVFAATATLAVLGAGRRPRGRLWRRHRPIDMAMAETVEGAGPILVLDHQTVATPFYLPLTLNLIEWRMMACWLEGRGAPPPAFRGLMDGDEMRCAEPKARASRRPAAGAMLAVANAAICSRKLAVLALHPYDPDAMGLHITLFGVEAVSPDALMRDYALEADALNPWLRTAERRNEKLFFLVGGVEEAFTQCSQNLFVKRPGEATQRRAGRSQEWSPLNPLESLLGKQFEIFQGTVSASGLPGVSPRNGDIGLAGFVTRRGKRTFVLIPYFTGNGVHGHAAKLWSNPVSSLLLWDDHTTCCAVTLSGPTRVTPHSWVAARFPEVAHKTNLRRRRSGAPAENPEYWYAQQVVDIRLQDEAVRLNSLDPARATCSIHAAGPAHHGKKPAYFATESLTPYDMDWQHEREARGRPRDPSGQSRRHWKLAAAPALDARRAHLARIAQGDGWFYDI
jgi:hypothetical protein